MKLLPYVLFWLIGRVGTTLAGSSESSEKTSEELIKIQMEYESGYKKDGAYILKRNIFQETPEYFASISVLNPVIAVIPPCITQQSHGTQSTGKSVIPRYYAPYKIHDVSRPGLVDVNNDPLNPVERHPRDYLRTPVHRDINNGLLKSVQSYHTPDLQEQVEIDLTQYLPGTIQPGSIRLSQIPAQTNSARPAPKDVQFNPVRFRQSPTRISTEQDALNAIELEPTDDLWKSVHSNSIKSKDALNLDVEEQNAGLQNLFFKFDVSRSGNRTGSSGKVFHLDTTLNLRKPETLSELRNLNETQRASNTNRSILNDQIHDPSHDIRKLVETNRTHDIAINQAVPIHDMIESVILPSHSPVKRSIVNQADEWKPVQLDPTHSMRKPIQLDPTHSLRKPVQVDPTHDLRRPVKVEPTHDLRKPIKSMESHDLRWPVIEESDHDMRNPLNEADLFRIGDADGKLHILKERLHKGSKTSFVNDPLHELLYEDEFLMLKCSPRRLNPNRNVFGFGTNPENPRIGFSKSQYKKLFNKSITACGIPFKHSAADLSKERKSTKWPWMVSLQQYIFDRFWHRCAGSLLNKLWVITAAHCVESRPKWDFLLQLGMDEDSRNYIERSVDRISIHHRFNILNLDHDIALLRMNSPADFGSSILPICLPWRPDEIENKKAVALGWKLATEQRISDGPSREKTGPVLTNKECEVMFSETGSSESIQKSFLCASFQNGRQDSCVGDSGGPLVILDNGRWLLAGLYSWGKSCTTPNQPEVYIRTSRYAEWIEDTISCYEENIDLHEMDQQT